MHAHRARLRPGHPCPVLLLARLAITPTGPRFNCQWGGNSRVTGNGTKESEDIARLANLWLTQLEKDISEMIRRALVWAQNHGEPLPRALARDYFQAAGEAQLAAIERTQAAADLNQARRARHDAQYYRDQCEAGLKGKEKLAWRLGCPPQELAYASRRGEG